MFYEFFQIFLKTYVMVKYAIILITKEISTHSKNKKKVKG